MKKGNRAWVLIILLLILILEFSIGLMSKIPETLSVITGNTVSLSCTETDGGINIYLRGTSVGALNGKRVSKTDACTSSTKVREWYCLSNAVSTNNMAYQDTNCQKRCLNDSCS